MFEFDVKYPVTFSPSGNLTLTESPASGYLHTMLDFVPGQRILRPDYGIDLGAIEQTTFNMPEVLSTILIDARENMARYMKNHVITSVVVERGTSRRTLRVSVMLVPIFSPELEVVTLELSSLAL